MLQVFEIRNDDGNELFGTGTALCGIGNADYRKFFDLGSFQIMYLEVFRVDVLSGGQYDDVLALPTMKRCPSRSNFPRSPERNQPSFGKCIGGRGRIS